MQFNFFNTFQRSLLLAGLLTVWESALLPLRADDVATTSLPNGVSLTIGENQLELQVATLHAFKLRLSPKDSPTPTKSILLSDTPGEKAPFTVEKAGSVVGLKTAFGIMKIDAQSNKWALWDSQGTSLVDWSSINLPDLQLVTPPSSHKALFYGSGSNPKLGQLTQTSASGLPENGSTSLPQYWSNTGYGILTISDDENRPASWKATDDGQVTWHVLGKTADLYVAPASNLYDWVRDQAELTGFAPIPPFWSFGYMQSRWGWKDKAYIDDTLARFHQDKLPVDTFIFDFEWYTTTPDYFVPAPGIKGFVDFSWNSRLLPEPEKQISDFLAQGLHVVGIRKPRLGNSDNLTMARSKGWILPSNPNDPNGNQIKSRNLDYSKPDVQSYWQDNNAKFIKAGMAGFWNDEGETSFTEYLYWNQTEVGLFKNLDPKARFWSINRSFAPGMQRFGAAAWTGDIRSKWDVLKRTPGELLSYGLSGMPYCTCDIGGFLGNPSPELYARWMEAGAFFPIDRSHSNITDTPRFPWLFGPDAETAVRSALNLRYRLIPYFYSLAAENHDTGAPLMRPLIMEFPDDASAVGLTDEWLMGKGLLVAPVLDEGGKRDLYLPGDAWFEFGSNHKTQGPQTLHLTENLDQIPIYVRAGTILPLGPEKQNTTETSNAPLELQIYPGHDGQLKFYEDDGKTLGYEKGESLTTAFTWNDSARTLSWKKSGTFHDNHIFTNAKVILFDASGPIEKSSTLTPDGEVRF